jgi:hypothetical protein
MPDTENIFHGCLPALMTPCGVDRMPDYDALVRTAQRLIETGMRGVVYCGSMGDWAARSKCSPRSMKVPTSCCITRPSWFSKAILNTSSISTRRTG